MLASPPPRRIGDGWHRLPHRPSHRPCVTSGAVASTVASAPRRIGNARVGPRLGRAGFRRDRRRTALSSHPVRHRRRRRARAAGRCDRRTSEVVRCPPPRSRRMSATISAEPSGAAPPAPPVPLPPRRARRSSCPLPPEPSVGTTMPPGPEPQLASATAPMQANPIANLRRTNELHLAIVDFSPLQTTQTLRSVRCLVLSNCPPSAMLRRLLR